jgi:hypothetical protein
MKNFKESFKGFAKIKQKGDEFIGKAILIVLALIIGGIMIATLKPQFQGFMEKTGTKMNSFFEDASVGG